MNTFVNGVKSMLAFLRTGAVAPNTPANMVEQVKRTNHFASRKFFIVFTSFLAMCVFYFASVAILFFLPAQSEIVSGYVTLFTKTIEVLAIIVASYLGVQAVVDLKYNSASNSEIQTSSTEKVIEEETAKYQTIFANDVSYAPLDWVMSYEERNNKN